MAQFQCLYFSFYLFRWLSRLPLPHSLLSLDSTWFYSYVLLALRFRQLYVRTNVRTHSQMAIINIIPDWQTCILTNKDVWIDQNQIDQAIYLFLFIYCNAVILCEWVSLSTAIYGPDDLRLTENKEIQHKLTAQTHKNTHIHLHTLYLYLSILHTFTYKCMTYIQSYVLVC